MSSEHMRIIEDISFRDPWGSTSNLSLHIADPPPAMEPRRDTAPGDLRLERKGKSIQQGKSIQHLSLLPITQRRVSTITSPSRSATVASSQSPALMLPPTPSTARKNPPAFDLRTVSTSTRSPNSTVPSPALDPFY